MAAHAIAQAGPEAVLSCLMALAVTVPKTILDVRTLMEATRMCGAGDDAD